MGKLLIFLALCTLVAFIKGQTEVQVQSLTTMNTDNDADIGSVSGGVTTLSPEDAVLQFSDVTLAVVGSRLAAANLSVELELAGQRILLDTAEGLAACEENLKSTHSIWQYKVCSAAQMRIAITAISALQTGSQEPTTSSA